MGLFLLNLSYDPRIFFLEVNAEVAPLDSLTKNQDGQNYIGSGFDVFPVGCSSLGMDESALLIGGDRWYFLVHLCSSIIYFKKIILILTWMFFQWAVVH